MGLPKILLRFCPSHAKLQERCLTELLSADPQGFPAKARLKEEGLSGEADKADEKRSDELQQSLVNLGVAWSLALLCCTHHVGHWLHALGFHSLAHGTMMNAMSNPWVSGMLGGFALLGPGRALVKDGALSLYRCVTNKTFPGHADIAHIGEPAV